MGASGLYHPELGCWRKRYDGKQFPSQIYQPIQELERRILCYHQRTGSTYPLASSCRKRQVHKKKRVVHVEEVFDILYEYHQSIGHLSTSSMTHKITENYFNITKEVVKIFCELCPICSEKSPRTMPHRGAAKPIYSFSFRDRFQVCHFSYQMSPHPLRLPSLLPHLTPFILHCRVTLLTSKGTRSIYTPLIQKIVQP
jgi:hypothetical protein